MQSMKYDILIGISVDISELLDQDAVKRFLEACTANKPAVHGTTI